MTTMTLCFFFFPWFMVGSPAGAATPPTSFSNLLTPSNVTEFGQIPGIDPRFSVKSEYGRSELPTIPCLMNAVNAMQDLALEDFEGPVVPITYILDSFPEVMISPEATTLGGAIETRFIIWGLMIGVMEMMKRGVFQTAVFTLGYEGITVGYVRIAQPGALFVAASNHTNSLAQSPADEKRSSGASANSTQETDDRQLTVSFNPIGPPLVAHDVLLAILYALVYTARFPATMVVEPFGLSLTSPYNMYIEGHPLAAASAATPPFLQYRGIVVALGQIPQYMSQRRRFSGVSFKMRFGRVTVGEGRMYKKQQ